MCKICAEFHPKNFSKTRIFTYLEDPGIPYRNPVIFSDNDRDVQSPPQQSFSVHYHFQEVIAFVGIYVPQYQLRSGKTNITAWKSHLF